MGDARADCVVRQDSMAVLEVLFSDQSHWHMECKRVVMRDCLDELASDAPTPNELWQTLKLMFIMTDEDLNCEFCFDASELGAHHRIYACGQGNAGFEEAFFQDS